MPLKRFRKMRWLWPRSGLWAFVFIICSSFCTHSLAHKLAPSLLQVDEVEARIYQLVWRTPLNAQTSPVPVLPETCREERGITAVVGTAVERRWRTNCDGGLEGETIGIELLSASRTVAMLRFKPLDGEWQQRILTPDAASYRVPERPSGAAVLGEYARLGVKHILVGADHLFFVTALLLLAGSWRTLLKTVTAFTVGHSVTLALVSLELIPHWPAFVEFLIAATILILALELSRSPSANKQNYLRRYQWSMAGVFGLVHGLGFAGVLSDIGIPAGEVIPALLAFNVGIEIGQLVFVGAAAGLLYAIRRSSDRASRWVASVLISVMGGFSVYWCLDRGTEMLKHFL